MVIVYFAFSHYTAHIECDISLPFNTYIVGKCHKHFVCWGNAPTCIYAAACTFPTAEQETNGKLTSLKYLLLLLFWVHHGSSCEKLSCSVGFLHHNLQKYRTHPQSHCLVNLHTRVKYSLSPLKKIFQIH